MYGRPLTTFERYTFACLADALDPQGPKVNPVIGDLVEVVHADGSVIVGTLLDDLTDPLDLREGRVLKLRTPAGPLRLKWIQSIRRIGPPRPQRWS